MYRIFCVIVAASFLAACSSKPEEMGVEIDGQRIPVIDVHMHTGTWEGSSEKFRNRLASRVPTGFKWTMSLFMDSNLAGDSLIGELDKGGISGGGVFALWSPATTGTATHEYVAEQVAVNPERLYGFASLRVDHWNQDGPQQLQMMEEAIQKYGFVGIKIAHGHQQFRFDDQRFYGIYEVATRQGTPIYLHTGTSPNPGVRDEPPYCDPAYLEEAIRLYPQTIFILGHTGYDSFNKALTHTDSAIDLAARYENVYLEPGAIGAHRAELVRLEFFEKIKAAGVIDKVIYGSDGPQMPGYMAEHLEIVVATMKEAGYTVDEMRSVLAGNFLRVFEMDPIEL